MRLGGLQPLIRQMLSPNTEVQRYAVVNVHQPCNSRKDIRIQRNATGALLNRTQSDENRQPLVNAVDICPFQYYCTTALSNFAKLLNTKPKLVQNLITLMDSPLLKVQRQATLALQNLTSEWSIHSLLDSYDSTTEKSQTEIFSIIESGFLHLLIDLLAYDENEEIQCHAISTLHNLAASSEKNKS
ncbi:ARM repeat-containing protein, partial [Atractiella rhizophila]